MHVLQQKVGRLLLAGPRSQLLPVLERAENAGEDAKVNSYFLQPLYTNLALCMHLSPLLVYLVEKAEGGHVNLPKGMVLPGS